MAQILFHTFNPLKLPGLVGEELEDFVDLGVESWLLGVPLTDHETTKETEVIRTQSHQTGHKRYKHMAHTAPSEPRCTESSKQMANQQKAKITCLTALQTKYPTNKQWN